MFLNLKIHVYPCTMNLLERNYFYHEGSYLFFTNIEKFINSFDEII